MFRLLTVLLALVTATSFADSSLWGGEATAAQQFRQANDPASRVSMETADHEVPLSKSKPAVKSTVNSAAVKPSTKSNSQSAVNPAQTGTHDTQVLQDQLNQLNQNNILFVQSTNNKFNELNSQLTSLQQQVKQLDQALLLLNQEVTQLNNKLNQTGAAVTTRAQIQALPLAGALQGTQHANLVLQWVQTAQQHLGTLGTYAVLAMLIALLGALLIWRRSHKKKQQISPAKFAEEADDDTRDEYDYMGSQESIPAKLNLARAYIAMEDYASAKKMIAEILMHGNDEQCREADVLMKAISQKT